MKIKNEIVVGQSFGFFLVFGLLVFANKIVIITGGRGKRKESQNQGSSKRRKSSSRKGLMRPLDGGNGGLSSIKIRALSFWS